MRNLNHITLTDNSSAPFLADEIFSFIKDKNFIRKNVSFVMDNKSFCPYADDILYLPFLDLMAVPVLEFDNFFFKFSKDVIKKYSLSEKEILEWAAANSSLENYRIQTLSQYFFGTELENFSTLYITDKTTSLLHKNVLKAFETLLGNSFFIIPSSRHELLFANDTDKEIVLSVHKTIQAEEMSENDILSYNCYHYNNGYIKIV